MEVSKPFLPAGYSTKAVPLVSIVIPNWNGRNLLTDCLTSLNNLTYGNYEIILVDNGSTDGSKELVRREFPGIKLVASARNLGFAGGCNLGMKVARGNFIALFNNDATAEPSWLAKLVDTLLKEPDVGLVSGTIFYNEPNDVVWSIGCRIDAITGVDWRVGHGKRLYGLEVTEDIDYVPGCAFIFPRYLLSEIGLLNENYFFYGEDVDWALSAKRLGYKFRINPTATVWHKASITRRRVPFQGYYNQMRGMFRIYLKHFPLRYMVTALCFQLFVFPIVETLLLRASPLFVIQRMKAFAWNMAKLKQIMHERRTVDSMGEVRLKNRFREFLMVAKGYASSKYSDF